MFSRHQRRSIAIAVCVLAGTLAEAQVPSVTWAVTPDSGTSRTEFTFAATVGGGAPPYRYNWNFGDGSPDEPTTQTVKHVFYRPGSYRVQLTVLDTRNAGAVVARAVSVDSPELDVSCDATPLTGFAPLAVEFFARPDGCVGPCDWRWDFGDGTFSLGVRDLEHVYREPGTFLAHVALTDALSFTPAGRDRLATCQRSIRVLSRQEPAGSGGPLAVGRFLYAVYDTRNGVSGFRIDQTTGALVPLPGSPFGPSPNPVSVAVDPSSQFVYTANGLSNTIGGFRIDPATGALTPLPGSPFPAGNIPLSLGMDPLGRFLYVANGSGSNISAFAIGSNGALTPVAGQPFAAGAFPAYVSVDPSGRFVYVASRQSQNISAFAISATGSLTPIVGSPFPAGGPPYTLVTDPASRFLFVTLINSNQILVYQIYGDGSLAPAPPAFASSGPLGVAVDASGRHLYVTNPLNNFLSAYAIASNGDLAATSPATFPAGSGPLSVVVDPSGAFVYVANGAASSVSAYARDAATGLLTPLGAFPAAAGAGFLAIAR